MSSYTTPEPMFSARDMAEDITLAVELKFLIRQPLSAVRSRYGGSVRPFVPHHPEESRKSMTEPETRLQQDNWEAVARAIDSLPGVSATTSHEVKARSLEHTHYWKTHWIVYKANSAAPLFLSYLQGDPNRPLLDKTAPDYDKYAWTPVEICSPILPWAQKQEVVSTLRRILGTVNSRFDVVANATTETHVHVGRADGRFYSLRTMKRLATLLWLSEPLLRAVKDPRSPNFAHHYTWSYPWREQSRLARAPAPHHRRPPPPPPGPAPPGQAGDLDNFVGTLLHRLDARRPRPATAGGEGHGDGDGDGDGDVDVDVGGADGARVLGEHRRALGAIWRAADHRALGALLRGPERKFRRLGFNFHALEMDEGEPGPRTVEVRFLEGFVDREVVPAWVRLCGELVDLVADRPGQDARFYDVVALLLRLPQDWPLDSQFLAFVDEMGRARVPKSVYEPLLAIIRRNYPPPRSREVPDAGDSPWYLV